MLGGLILSALVAGCASRPEPVSLEGSPGCSAPALPSQPVVVGTPLPLLARVWLCSDQKTIAIYPRGNSIDLLDRGCQMTLPRVASASGARYENQAVAFWDKGSEATLQRKPGRVHGCREILLMSQLEDARIRGVTWRGHGVDGDWHMDVGPGAGLTFVRAGVPALVFNRPTSVTDPNTRTSVYTARQGEHTITVKLTDLLCRDKAGNTLPGSADIVLDGATYEGCGVALSR